MKLPKLITDISYNISTQLALERNGVEIEIREKRPYMITDYGLTQLLSVDPYDINSLTGRHLLYYILGCKLGEGDNPIRRAGGSTLFNLSLGTITTVGSTSFFTAGDVGRLFKFGTGTSGIETYITGFVSDHEVTCDDVVNTESGNTGVVWYTNSPGLITPLAGIIKDYYSASSGTTSIISGDELLRIHTFKIITTPLTKPISIIRELILCRVGDPSTNGFDRDEVLPPLIGIVGDRVAVTVQVEERIKPIVPTVSPNVGIGLDTTGLICFLSRYGLPSVSSLGIPLNYTGILSHHSFDYGSSVYRRTIGVIPSDFTLSYTNNDSTSTVAPYRSNAIGLPGTRNKSVVEYEISGNVGPSLANGTNYGVGLGREINNTCLAVKFTTPFIKTSLQRVIVTFKHRITRILTNS